MLNDHGNKLSICGFPLFRINGIPKQKMLHERSAVGPSLLYRISKCFLHRLRSGIIKHCCQPV